MFQRAVSRFAYVFTAMLFAHTAYAVEFIAISDTPGPIAVGDTFTAIIEVDASDLDNASDTSFGFGISLNLGGGDFTVVGGTQAPATFQIDFGGPAGGIPLASAVPPNNNIDPGVVLMATFISGLTPAGAPFVDFSNALNGPFIADVVLRANEAGTFSIAPFFSPDDGFDVNGVDIEDQVGLTGFMITVPEPGAGVMAIGAFVTVLGVARFNRRSDRAGKL